VSDMVEAFLWMFSGLRSSRIHCRAFLEVPVFQTSWVLEVSNVAGRNVSPGTVASPDLGCDRIDSSHVIARRLESRQQQRFGLNPQVLHLVLRKTCGFEEQRMLTSLCATKLQHQRFPGRAF